MFAHVWLHAVTPTASRAGKSDGSDHLGYLSHIRQEIRLRAHVETTALQKQKKRKGSLGLLPLLNPSAQVTDMCEGDDHPRHKSNLKKKKIYGESE